MVFKRHLTYGITSSGEKEFLHSFLNLSGAKKYIQDHSKTFPSRYVKYHIYSADKFIEEVCTHRIN